MNPGEAPEEAKACQTHGAHDHAHGAACGHPGIAHQDHVDYLHDGHLHHVHGDHIDEHQLEVSGENPSVCAPVACAATHGESIPHGDHADYLVNGRLHHAHADHCDDHGPVRLVH
jgi:hypothetical protein